MKKVYDADLIKLMTMFESVSGVSVKDCVSTEQMIVFVVPQGDVGRAVGKGGVNVRKLERLLNKKVKVIEFSDSIDLFIRNVVSPNEVSDVIEDDGVYTLVPKDLKTRGMLIGRNASHLRFFESLVQRFYPIKELKVQ